ncbi:MAG: ATP-binding protein [Gaiellaceae bacterium]
MRSDLPSGTVTFLFTDIEGSTLLLSELGAEAYADALAGHRRVIREACATHGGAEVDTQGDAFFFAFPTAPGALAAAADLTEALHPAGRIRVRVGLHTGTPLLGDEGYVGHDVHRAARIVAAGHGGQVLVSASTATLIETELTDLGEHRFKDLGAPERVYQLGDGEFGQLRSLYRTNLPVPATPFLGRERELHEVAELLAREDARLVTLTGPGGTGKTRLALQAAAEASDGFPDGVFWVPLAPLRDVSLLETTFAQALEVSEQPGIAIADSIVKSFAGKRALIVVDNCEHLLDAAAALLRKLGEGCPQIVISASSRERLGLRAERVYAVPPMSPLDAELLFCERALAVASDFEPDENVAAICDAVDGLPLAVELAAVRARSLSTQAIRERLGERLGLLSSRDRDVDERQRTLEATIAWSYELLHPEEQRALRALSVFAGGCTLEAAEATAGADLDLLESLFDKSLIRHRVDEAGQDRYWMLETIREYMAMRLAEAGASDLARTAHREYFVRQGADLAITEAMPGPEINRFKADRANYRIVLLDAVANADGQTAIPLAASLGWIWYQVGELADSYALLRSVLALPGGDDRDRGFICRSAGDLAAELDDYEEANRLFDQADVYAAACEDRLLEHKIMHSRAYRSIRVGDYAQAAEWAIGAAGVARAHGFHDLEIGARWLQLQAMRMAGTDRDEPDVRALERCIPVAGSLLQRSAEAENVTIEAQTHAELGAVYLGLSRYEEALPHQQASLRFEATTGRRWVLLDIIAIGTVSGRLGDHVAAVRLASFARCQHELEGRSLDRDDVRSLGRIEAEGRAALGDAGYEAEARQGAAMTLDEAIEVALSLAPDS